MTASSPRRGKKVAGGESQGNSSPLQHAVASADQSRPLESGISALTLGLIAAAVGVALYVNTLVQFQRYNSLMHDQLSCIVCFCVVSVSRLF